MFHDVLYVCTCTLGIKVLHVHVYIVQPTYACVIADINLAVLALLEVRLSSVHSTLKCLAR